MPLSLEELRGRKSHVNEFLNLQYFICIIFWQTLLQLPDQLKGILISLLQLYAIAKFKFTTKNLFT